MLEWAIDTVTGQKVSISKADKSHPHICGYCQTNIHPHAHHHFVRDPGAPEHSHPTCINIVSTPHSDVKQRIKNTKKEHLFRPLENSFDILPLQEPALRPHVPPINQVDPLEPFNGENMPTPLITINQLEAIANITPDLADHIQTMRLNNIDSVSLLTDDIEDLDLTIDDVTRLLDCLNAQDHALTNRDVQTLSLLLEDSIQHTSSSPIERPIRTLLQFYKSGLIFMPPRTKLQDCQLRNLFLSYYYDEYKHYFDRNYKNLGQRILYCEFTPIRTLDESAYPSLRFNMYWGNPSTKITLYINFKDNAPHSAKDFYENFIRNKLELRMNSEGISEWCPKNASRIASSKEKYYALVYGDWKNAERFDRYNKGTHYISLRTNYLSLKQILFVRGYEP